MLRYYPSVKKSNLMLVRVACWALCKFPYVKCKTNMQNPSTCCDLVALSLYLSSWFASTMGPTGFWRTLLRVSCYPYVCDAHIADTMQFHFQKVSPASQHQFGLLRSLKHHASKLLWNFGVHHAMNMWLGMYGAPTWKLIKLFSSGPFIYRLFRTEPWLHLPLCVMGLGFSPFFSRLGGIFWKNQTKRKFTFKFGPSSHDQVVL